MRYHHLISFIFFISLIWSNAFAQTEQQIQSWKRIVDEKSLPEIAKLMSDRPTTSWPKAESFYAAQHLSVDMRAASQDAIDLVKALHGKIKREFRPDTPVDGDFQTYSTIASTLDRAGGYYNMLLADSVRRLAVFRASEALVHGTQPLDRLRHQTEQIVVPHVEIRDVLKRLAGEDEAVGSNFSNLEKITPEMNVFGALQAARLGDATSLMGWSYSQLMGRPSAAALLVRMAATESLYSVSLKGLLAFVEKGGNYQELDPSDIRQFKNRMGGNEKTFNCPALGVRQLQVGHVRNMFDLHKEPASREAFFKAVFD